MIYLVVAFGIIAVGGVACAFVFYKKNFESSAKSASLQSSLQVFEEKNRALENELDSQKNEIRALIEEKTQLSTALEYEKKIHNEKIAEFNELKNQSKNEFKVLAQGILDEITKKHSQAQEENLGHILKPLSTQIDAFKKRVDEVYDKEMRERSDLGSEIKHLKELNLKISQDAINLTNALKGSSKAQGDWGEIILENLLEDSGLIKDREYILQKTYKNEEGDHFRPDVIVKLPNNKRIIIDSKVSLTHYEKFVSKQDKEELTHHVLSLKTHVKALSNKKYDELLEGDSLDFVLMFIPIEGAFLDALRFDTELFKFAYDKNVILVCPTTLLATLRTIWNLWRNEHQRNNVKEILHLVSGVYDKFVNFYSKMEDIGKNINKAEESYKSALNQLKDGRGSIYSKIQKLESLGVKIKESLPDNAGNLQENELKSLQSEAK